MALNFTAIDFETANGSPSSPCAVGLVKVSAGKIIDSYQTLIQPPYPHDWFEPGNIKIHGIKPSDVVSAPSWETALGEMIEFISGDDLMAHNAGFDMGVLLASIQTIDAEIPDLRYGCSLLMARKTYNLESYRLNQVAYAIGHEEFDHHDALADSDACARIVIHMAKRHEVESLEDLAKATNQTIKSLRPATE
ncbi:MAG: DNA polymerase III subunit epsilon [Actinobacteria bacterium]|jgi:DNA polymerase III subunit epsilon|nr:DNA polymerase III subunit epsilon [Actinomycetota bacterium]